MWGRRLTIAQMKVFYKKKKFEKRTKGCFFLTCKYMKGKNLEVLASLAEESRQTRLEAWLEAEHHHLNTDEIGGTTETKTAPPFKSFYFDVFLPRTKN